MIQIMAFKQVWLYGPDMITGFKGRKAKWICNGNLLEGVIASEPNTEDIVTFTVRTRNHYAIMPENARVEIQKLELL
jgi:hypothetical protein